MKVGTDGILLGAWADVSDCQYILDMGTGTGLVALMLAQRSHEHCQIEAVELDPLATQQAQENFQASPWHNRLYLTHLDWLNWAASCLSEKGKISFVLPYEAGKTLINSTALCCIKQTDVITKTGKDPQRILLTFSREHLPQVKDSLVIYNENNQYTEEFIALTKAFYLKM